MKYYHNHEDERAERIWELVIKIIITPCIIGFAIAIYKIIKNYYG